MDQPVTNDACEQRRCELRKLVREEVRDVMATVTDNKNSMHDWLVRLEGKMDTNNTQINSKIDTLRNLMVVLILAIAIGSMGIRMGWV